MYTTNFQLISFKYYYFILLIVLCSCKSSDETYLEKKYNEKLSEWNFNTQVSIINKHETLYIDLFFEDSVDVFGVEANLVDLESNNLLVSMLNYTFYEYIKEYDIIIYNLRFENQDNMYDYTIEFSESANRKDKDFEEFTQAPMFYSFVEYAYKEIKRADFVRSNVWIEYLSEFPDFDFSFSGSFWKLLHNYSLECSNQDVDKKYTYLFIVFVSTMVDPNNPTEEDIQQEKFLYYIENCGYEFEEINLTLSEIKKALGYKATEVLF